MDSDSCHRIKLRHLQSFRAAFTDILSPDQALMIKEVGTSVNLYWEGKKKDVKLLCHRHDNIVHVKNDYITFASTRMREIMITAASLQ